MTGLSNGATYFIRSYATNSMGTVYGNLVSINAFSAVYDIDGNGYDTVNIGMQVWLKQNLKTTHYNNGLAIDYPDTNNLAWSNNLTGAYAWYNNDSVTNANIYGALYNWYAVTKGNLCPIGWHVPTELEFTTLSNYLGGDNIAGGKLKETGLTHWISPNSGATNETSFTALPNGYRNADGIFFNLGVSSYFWSSTVEFLTFPWSREVSYLNNRFDKVYESKEDGFSVRCLKD